MIHKELNRVLGMLQVYLKCHNYIWSDIITKIMRPTRNMKSMNNLVQLKESTVDQLRDGTHGMI